MLRQKAAFRVLRLISRSHSRYLFHQTREKIPSRYNTGLNIVTVTAAATVVAGSLLYIGHQTVHGDASIIPNQHSGENVSSSMTNPDEERSLKSMAWGSNRFHVLSPESQSPESMRVPTSIGWLQSIALRDLALHHEHAACIDARGDVYQWGDGFFGQEPPPNKPVLTLHGKNIVALQATSSRIFALSASGKIYVLSSSFSTQEPCIGVPSSSDTPWWGTGWIWGEEKARHFAEITPEGNLGWGERFVSISAGSDHLLALTSSGRTFAHPMNLNANSHGQLGMRKVNFPDHSDPTLPPSRKFVELMPKSISDPYAKATPATRRVFSPQSGSGWSEPSKGNQITFSDKLFEVPALKGIRVEQITTGGRSSFARTSQGKVLGWGANEFGQIGLGGNVTLESITVPTEVALWRNTPQATRTTCLGVYAGGDLTLFTVERSDGTAAPYTDVLACGNGQWGGLGSSTYSNAQGTPIRVKNVSGLLEYNEQTKTMKPIIPYDISVSPTGHVLLTLETLARSGSEAGGRDLIVWGANHEYQLGNGKRGSLASPTAMEPGSTGGLRFMLGKKQADICDLRGKLWKRSVKVEQRAVTGYGTSVVYWKIQ